MAQLPAIHLIHVSDAPQHIGKLKVILQKLKAENRITEFGSVNVESQLATLQDQVGDNDLVLSVLTLEFEPYKKQTESILRAVDLLIFLEKNVLIE